MEAVDFGKFEWAARRSKRRPVQLETRNYIITTSRKKGSVDKLRSIHVVIACAYGYAGDVYLP
jgi:hypothetical protein